VQILLDKGAKINSQAKNGVSALIIASQEGHEAIVQILLAKGAEVNVRENGGETALKFAKTQKIKTLLKAAGASE
jgi:ankyrin repeat protein